MTMKITVRKIGNSRGVLIPAALLAACRIENEIELHVDEGRLVMGPVRAPRAGWFDKLAAEKEAAGAGWPDVLPGGDKDWAW
jgi:antitoxin MazE